MPSDEATISRLTAAQIGDAVAVLRAAFRDDPIFIFHFPDPDLRSRVLGIFFSHILRTHMRFQHVYAAFKDSRLVGVAVWRPPDATVRRMRDRLRDYVMRYRLVALSPQIANKLLRGFAALEATHPSIPHWYLFFIGVESRQRGRGIGAQLMAPVFEAADAARTLCYLETPFPQTLSFYRKLGYEISSEPRPFPGAPQLWAMTRRPKSQS